MLRPQGLFQNPQPKPFDWQQTYAPPAGGRPTPPLDLDSTMPHPPPTPGEGQYQAPGGGQYPEGNQYQTSVLPPGGPTPPGAGYPAGGAVPEGGPYPPGAYGPGQYPAGQYAPGQYPTAQYAPGQPGPGGQRGHGPGGQFGPGQPYGPDGLLLPDGPPPRNSRRGLISALVVAAIIVIVVVAVLLAKLGGSSTPSTTAGGTGATTAATPAASAHAKGKAKAAAAAAERQAAVKLSGLLAQSGTDRSDVNAAYANVQSCGKNLGNDATLFNNAAANRRTLLAKLGKLPGRSALSAAMVADLTAAWKASATVDSDLGKWAATAAGHCHKGNSRDPNLSASTPYDSQATNNKTAFARLWNQLARKDSLPTYTVSQL